MNMFDYAIGTVVREKDGSRGGIYSGNAVRDMFGHVVGFTINAFFETILVVKWDDGSEQQIHPNNVLTKEQMK